MSPECPICHSRASSPFWSRVWGAPGKSIHVCSDCESYFQWPPNTEEEQREFDRNYDRYIGERAAAVEPNIQEQFTDLVDKSIEERLADVQSWFAGARSLLEIGAEVGGFLDRLKAQVPELVAVDAAPEYAAILKRKGYESYRYLDEVPAGRRFDRICFFSLLEHIREPESFLAQVARHLNPSGMVVIEVPSVREPLVSLYEIPAFKDFYFQAMHPQVFSPKALELVLARAGFENITLYPKQRYGLDNHLQWLRKGVPGGAVDLAALFAGATNAAYLASLERAGITDSIYATAQVAGSSAAARA